MIPLEIAATLLLAILGLLLLVLALALSLERRHRTEAKRKELEAPRSRRPRNKFLLWDVVGPSLFIGLLVLLIVDGLAFRIGLLYAPNLSFFNPFDTHMQLAGLVLASLGVVISAVAVKPLVVGAFAQASGEERLVTTGIYAYVRHPLYLADFLIPVGLFLITLNVVGLLLLPPLWFHTDGDLAACGRAGRMTFLTRVIECEEGVLLQKHGEEYEEYMERTGRLLPRIRR